jgi:hypothetical protein
MSFDPVQRESLNHLCGRHIGSGGNLDSPRISWQRIGRESLFFCARMLYNMVNGVPCPAQGKNRKSLWIAAFCSGQGRDRTGDLRIFSAQVSQQIRN